MYSEILVMCIMLHFLLNLTMLKENGLASVSLFRVTSLHGQVPTGEKRNNDSCPSVYTF